MHSGISGRALSETLGIQSRAWDIDSLDREIQSVRARNVLCGRCVLNFGEAQKSKPGFEKSRCDRNGTREPDRSATSLQRENGSFTQFVCGCFGLFGGTQ